jgi:hypothetical protein
MRTRWHFALYGAILLAACPSCEVLTFSKDFEFNMIFEVNSDSTSLYESNMLDAMAYVTSIEEYTDQIETIEINSVTCSISSLSGTDDQILTNGLLTVSDETGSVSQTLTSIPTDLLQNLQRTEKTLILDEAGIIMAEDLIKNVPHKCQGILTGDISSSPVSFIMTFHVELTITGTML